ncbi:MAG: hypothetical protein M1825_001316 [Sarcosagium campestre]|nr:MAG: hypothetical protein M1825_001316 [Sarcosagium campestre]
MDAVFFLILILFSAMLVFAEEDSDFRFITINSDPSQESLPEATAIPTGLRGPGILPVQQAAMAGAPDAVTPESMPAPTVAMQSLSNSPLSVEVESTNGQDARQTTSISASISSDTNASSGSSKSSSSTSASSSGCSSPRKKSSATRKPSPPPPEVAPVTRPVRAKQGDVSKLLMSAHNKVLSISASASDGAADDQQVKYRMANAVAAGLLGAAALI